MGKKTGNEDGSAITQSPAFIHRQLIIGADPNLDRKERTMTQCRSVIGILALAILWSPWVIPLATAQTNAFVLYTTGFEAIEGFDAQYTLAGQNQWIGEGTGGNGLVENFFAGQGQQAFLGFSPPSGPEDANILYRPLNYVPPTNVPVVVRFSVDMSIIDSTNGYYDSFQWNVYNLDTNRLFTLDFDNFTYHISYSLDNTNGFISTGMNFSNNVIYRLDIEVDFTANRWSATLNQNPLVTAQPITTRGSARDLGDIDAVWVLANSAASGNNYMLFDNYRVTAELVTTPPPTLLAVSYSTNGQFLLRLTGAPGKRFAIDASTNWFQWTALITNSTSATGTLDYLDRAATNYLRRFYRGRVVP
jgi:hypothetical protein